MAHGNCLPMPCIRVDRSRFRMRVGRCPVRPSTSGRKRSLLCSIWIGTFLQVSGNSVRDCAALQPRERRKRPGIPQVPPELNASVPLPTGGGSGCRMLQRTPRASPSVVRESRGKSCRPSRFVAVARRRRGQKNHPVTRNPYARDFRLRLPPGRPTCWLRRQRVDLSSLELAKMTTRQ